MNHAATSPVATASHNKPNLATAEQIGEFDQIIDVRSPGEFAEDHIPGAINCPVLDNDERVRVGTLYKQVSSFEAKKLGAALVAKNIALHLEQEFVDKPKNWKPLIYCWRGGTRSGAMTHILRQVGWPAMQLDGGYKSYRRHVIQQLDTLPEELQFHVICGATGSGKSRLLNALEAQNAQVLDLEDLAAHRGSVLGNLPDKPQPAQKMFESLVCDKLATFDLSKPVYVEAESKKVGVLRVPDKIIDAMWQRGRCIRIETSVEARVKLLCEEYEHFFTSPEVLFTQLDCLKNIHGAERIASWKQMAREKRWDQLVRELLQDHYDPAYRNSTLSHYPQIDQGLAFENSELSPFQMTHLAAKILQIS
ncbi:MAG: tRNA 2-selenouridine(34) synthase MnmH [Burkholderiales bacterium]